MDTRNKTPLKLFGTPLSKSLDDVAPSELGSGPINRRRARLERNQIVQDEHNQRRFHGAFTGGFSAGYHNTVGSAQGFQPKTFTSRRGERRPDGGVSRFEHRPEDYMDEEDFSEFGIAPKKIRVAGQFSEGIPGSAGLSTGRSLRMVVNDSIGEKILRSMTRNRRVESLVLNQPILPKNDYHGLGYQPLSAKTSTSGQPTKNPLIATLKSGMQLKIVGEAFGVGVLDADEDNLHDTNEYGYDDIANYDFPKSKSSTTERRPKQQMDRKESSDKSAWPTDSHLLPGFSLAEDLNAMKLCDNECLNYPLPVIEADWKMPVRTEPLIRPPDESDLNRQNIDSYKNRISSFNAKFAQSESGHSNSVNDIEGRSGLVPYSYLKTLVSTSASNETSSEQCTSEGVSISRRVLEWRPCSLLCKHFGVDNPFPDNKFCGVRPIGSRNRDEADPCQRKENDESHFSLEVIAPIKLRESIFNVCFDEPEEVEIPDHDAEDEPQIIDLELSEPAIDLHQASPDMRFVRDDTDDMHEDPEHEPEVVVVEVSKKEPELIVLSSSESPKSSRSVSAPSDDDDDAYGPLLPPSRRTLQGLDRYSRDREPSTSTSSAMWLKRKRHKLKSQKSKKSKRHKRSG